MSNRKIHFHSSDDRFCGCREVGRQFSMEVNEITCDSCKAKDTFVLSPEAARYVANLSQTAEGGE
jgi:Zn finger protein HypA/HybF involved in hydrogenase expression